MLALGKRTKAIFVNPKKELQALMPELRILRDNLKMSRHTVDPLTEIVNFFDYVSRWQDRGLGEEIKAFNEVNYGQYTEIISKLKALNGNFEGAGRVEFGWNRTQTGETVTAHNVYLGNIYGLWTKTVAFWQSHKDQPKGGWGFSGMEHLNAYDVVSGQASSFMKSYIPEMIDLIDQLEALSLS